jgi:hypothetical protein
MAYLRSLDEAMPAMGTSNRALSENAEASSGGGHE